MEDTPKIIVINKIANINNKLQKHICKITKQIIITYLFIKVVLLYGCSYFLWVFIINDNDKNLEFL